MASVIFKTEELTTLPESGEKFVLYIVGDSDPRRMYIWNGTAFVEVGNVITVDSHLSSVSSHPVQNKVITSALNEKQASLDRGGITVSSKIVQANSCTDEGFYRIPYNSTYVYSQLPRNLNYNEGGFLRVSVVGNARMQECFYLGSTSADAEIYIRFLFSGTTWQAWRKIAVNIT